MTRTNADNYICPLSPIHLTSCEGSEIAGAVVQLERQKNLIGIRLLESGDGVVSCGAVAFRFVARGAGTIRDKNESVGVEVDLELFDVFSFVLNAEGAGEEIAGDGDGGGRRRGRKGGRGS